MDVDQGHEITNTEYGIRMVTPEPKARRGTIVALGTVNGELDELVIALFDGATVFVHPAPTDRPLSFQRAHDTEAVVQVAIREAETVEVDIKADTTKFVEAMDTVREAITRQPRLGPRLGYATTRQLLDELVARVEVDGTADYRTVDDQSPVAIVGGEQYERDHAAGALLEIADQIAGLPHGMGPANRIRAVVDQLPH